MPRVTYNYDPSDYSRFAVTVDIAVFTIRNDALQVLLIERGQEPFLGALALPGGFVRPDEDLDGAAERELAEETGLHTGSWHLEQLASYGAPERDQRMRVVTVAYWAICAELPALRGGGDAAAAAVKPVEEIERGSVRLAFDHGRIVRDAVERARSKLEYTALAARFCPPEFTVSQLRRVFETVWNTRLDPGNFQRNVQERGTFERRDAVAAPPPCPGADARPHSGRSVIRPFSRHRWRGRLRGEAEEWARRSNARLPRRRLGGRPPHQRSQIHRRTRRNSHSGVGCGVELEARAGQAASGNK